MPILKASIAPVAKGKCGAWGLQPNKQAAGNGGMNFPRHKNQLVSVEATVCSSFQVFLIQSFNQSRAPSLGSPGIRAKHRNWDSWLYKQPLPTQTVPVER